MERFNNYADHMSKNWGFNSTEIFDVLNMCPQLKPESNMVVQVGDHGPVVTFDVVHRVILNDDWYGKDNAHIDRNSFHGPKLPKLTYSEFLEILTENPDKHFTISDDVSGIDEIAICENFEELKKYVKAYEYYDVCEKDLKKANLTYPAIVFNDCSYKDAFKE